MPGTSRKSYGDLLIGQRGMDLAEACYRVAGMLPDTERYGLASQLRRAVVSVPANIAEGYGRETDGAFGPHLRTGRGSLKELETHLLLIERLRLGDAPSIKDALNTCDELGRMLRAMIRSLKEERM